MTARMVFSIQDDLKDQLVACLEYRQTHKDDFIEDAVKRYIDETILIYENDPVSLQLLC